MKKKMSLGFEELNQIDNLGDLVRSGYTSVPVQQELRNNLIGFLTRQENPFAGIHGYDDSVLPDMERAILSMHDINLLGLRGQAKTKLARMMTNLLDEYIPVIKGTEMNDDPFAPISVLGRTTVREHDGKTPIEWMHRDDRYTEKLATPDVTVADLIGDVDPIKAANLKLPYSDERVIHFGLVPRSNRGIFVINELPDLQARIQVALFNILQEGDIQIRGFKIRLPLDIQFVFTANPEDYTNRGSIVTPLKDRIASQIITHYPGSIEIGKKITQQESRVKKEQCDSITLYELARDLIEQIAIEARKSEYVDEKSGVSARLTISALENLYSTAERRAIKNNETDTTVRIGDFVGIVPSITGKIELVYEGEQEGPGIVALTLFGKAIRALFTDYFRDPDKERKKEGNIYKSIIEWFGAGNKLDLITDLTEKEYRHELDKVAGLRRMVGNRLKDIKEDELHFMMEFALHGLAEYSMLSKKSLQGGMQFKDLLSSMLPLPETEDDQPDYLSDN